MSTTVKDFKVQLEAILVALKEVPDDQRLSIMVQGDQIDGIDELVLRVSDDTFTQAGVSVTETLIDLNWTCSE